MRSAAVSSRVAVVQPMAFQPAGGKRRTSSVSAMMHVIEASRLPLDMRLLGAAGHVGTRRLHTRVTDLRLMAVHQLLEEIAALGLPLQVRHQRGGDLGVRLLEGE